MGGTKKLSKFILEWERVNWLYVSAIIISGKSGCMP